ncbi:type VII secretion protein EccE [Actinophytocola sp. NPDC049390]|uniref:type VII secretion protein EccE n=1 Tax=Actinophytocola sp. NPDC049390 TaxID=3363894 RepID=UPI0037A97533
MTTIAGAPDTTSGTAGHRSFRWLLPIAARQVVVWQLAALAVLITAFPLDGAAIPAIAAAVLAVAATTVRVGGLCGYQWLAIAARFLVRRRPREAAATPLLALEPKLTISTHVGRGGERVGVTSVGDGPGHSVTIRLAPGTNPDPAALISLLRTAFDRTDVPLAAASLVSWSTPGRPVTPAPVTLYWLALHYRQDDAPAAALARGGGADGARRAATAAALRLVTDLAGAGYDSSVLDPRELHDDLITATGTGHDARYVAASTVGYRARESWDGATLGTHRQVCLVPLAADEVVASFGRCPRATTFTSTAYTLRRSAWGTTTTSAAVRVGLPNYRTRLTAEQRTQLGRLFRADGRHRRTTLTTLPLALG